MFWRLLTLLLSIESEVDLCDLTVIGRNGSFWMDFMRSNISFISQVSFVSLTENTTQFNRNPPTFLLIDLTSVTDIQNGTALSKILPLLRQNVAGTSITCLVLNKRLLNLQNEHQINRVFRTKLPKLFQLASSRLYLWNRDENDLIEAYFSKELLTLKIVENSNGEKSTVQRRRNLNMQQLTVGKKELSGGGTTSVSGTTTVGLNPMWSLRHVYLAYMQDYLNFTIAIIGHADWVAMFKSLQDRKVDLGDTTSLVNTPAIATDIRFLNIPTYQETIGIYFHTPEGTRTVRELFHLKPFKQKTWLAMFLILFLLFGLHYLMSSKETMDESFLYALSILAMQGFNVMEKNSVRTLTVAGFILFYILNAVYSGALTSSLSTRTEQKYYLEDLVKLGYSFGFEKYSYLHGTYRYGSNSTVEAVDFSSLFSHLHPVKGMTQIPEGIHRVLKHKKYGFATEINPLLLAFPNGQTTVGEKTICKNMRYTKIPHSLVLKAPIITRDSPFSKHFNLARIRMRETGIWFRHNRENDAVNENAKPQCSRVTSIPRRLDTSDVLLPGMCLSIGFGLCAILFFGEFFLHKYISHKIPVLMTRIKNVEN